MLGWIKSKPKSERLNRVATKTLKGKAPKRRKHVLQQIKGKK